MWAGYFFAYPPSNIFYRAWAPGEEKLVRNQLIRLWILALLGGVFWGVRIGAILAAPVDFAHDVMPLLKKRCAQCHTNGEYKGGLSMDTRHDILRAKVVVPGKSSASELITRVTSNDPDTRMPPKGERLTEKEVQLLRDWIDENLPWTEGFSFKAQVYQAPLHPRRPEIPPMRADGPVHPLDRLVNAYAQRQGQTLPALADDATFLRRVYQDLVGQLPASDERAAFLADASKDKRQRLARYLLDDRQAYADHWLSFWNDLLRNDYAGTGYIDGGRRQITPWLYQALVDNKPYDQFTRELIHPTPASDGFINGIKWRGRVNASQTREVQFAQNISQVFLGINMKCASCHDSFIDGWKLEDAYGLAAILSDRPLEIHRCDKPTGKIAQPRFVWPELGTIDPQLPTAKRLEQLSKLMTHSHNGRFSRTIVNRLWQRLFGRGLVHPVDSMANRPWSVDVLDYLATYLSDNQYDLKKLLEHITTSNTYQSRSAALVKEPMTEEYIFRGPEIKRMTAEQFLDAIWMITGTGPTKPAVAFPEVSTPSGLGSARRYVRSARVRSDPLMRSLGRPNREQVVTTREGTLTTLQALDLANGQLLADTLARAATARLRRNPKIHTDTLFHELFTEAFCRSPTQTEREQGAAILGTTPNAEGLSDLMWILFMQPEFQLIR